MWIEAQSGSMKTKTLIRILKTTQSRFSLRPNESFLTQQNVSATKN